uniref:Alkylated DNA repair protein AlkB homologue 8 N-terminal domain-containing protein n=2 Tax=Astatotilapia calliptera TaxID=8154 RepID=A0AAX7TNI9_ASTCA
MFLHPYRNCDSFTMSDYLVGVAGPNSIGISSLKSLFDQTNISDEVIDGLIYLQCENFPHIYPIPSQITGKILDGSTRAQSAYFLKKNIFQMYEKLIGACLENGSHWTLFVSCTDFALSLVHDTFQCPSLGILKAQAYLSWGNHITSVVRKAQQRLYYLRRLRSAHIPRSLMLNFYNCAISSVLTYGFLVWFPSCTKADQQALQRVVKEAGRIIGTSLPEISNIFPTRCLRRVHSILRDQHHLARHLFHLLPSGRRYRSIQARTSRLANSLYPQAVRLLNSLPPSHGQ